MDDRMKVKDIIKKLKKLDCPLLGSGEDAWITEILFKPNFDRYHLMEWIFSKLEFSIPKADGCQNSSEVKVKNLLAAISALGLCGKDRSDVIQGFAPFKDQLNLWKHLVDIMWKKCSCAFQNKAESSSNSNGSRSVIEQEYVLKTNYINKLCESVNLNYIFKDKIQLFPPYLLKESKEEVLSPDSKIECLEDIKRLALEGDDTEWKVEKVLNGRNDTELKKQSMDIFHESEIVSESNFQDSSIQNEEGLSKVEDDICSSLIELKKLSTTDFNNAHRNLKLYLNVPDDESTDVGPSFKTAKCELESFLKLKNSLSTMKSSESELKTLSSDLQNFEVPSEPMSDSLLREGISLLNDKSNGPVR